MSTSILAISECIEKNLLLPLPPVLPNTTQYKATACFGAGGGLVSQPAGVKSVELIFKIQAAAQSRVSWAGMTGGRYRTPTM